MTGRSGDLERIFLRPIATPVPLGFLGLMVATATLACFNLGWVPVSEQHQVALVLVGFAAPLQLLACVFCFLGRDAPAAAGIGVQGASWLAIGLVMLSVPAGGRSATLSVLLFSAAGAIVPSALTSMLGKLVPGAVMLGTVLRFVLTGIYERWGGSGWEHAAGWEGVALAALALYAALAADLEGAVRRSVLPLGRHRTGRRALEPGLGAQTEEISTEPGVRQQL